MWDEPKIVHGKPRHSQSQGSVERANQDIEKMLFTWLSFFLIKIHSVYEKQSSHHSGINRSPYEAMFGCKAKVGLKTVLPSLDGLSKITSEEDLEPILKDQSDNQQTVQE